MKWLLIVLMIWNLIVFITYGIDKRKSMINAWRISEKTLIIMTLCGGGFGGLLGGEIFHHKTRKWYFQLTWYIGLLIQVLLCYFVWHVKK